ncbi:MAG: ROK family protein [Anaerolineae bacterium]|nr:ROK family protein [Anaerolineae bacterium]MDW8069099.1 ROK family protein [Anaerolineae bacterium]
MYILAVDLGGTQIRAARCTPDGRMEGRVAIPTLAAYGPEVVLDRIRQAIRNVWPVGGEPVAALALSAPGPVDAHRGIVRFTPNIPGWKDVPLRDLMAETFRVPTFLANDANLAALGEFRFGAGRGVQDLIYLTISTGIGGGIIIDGRLYEGGQGLGGEVGHMVVEPSGPPCGCGGYGCLEAVASGTAIAREARAALEGGTASLLGHMVDNPEAITAREVAEAAAQGDNLSRRIYARAGFYVGLALVSLMYLFNPALFIIGGSVANAGALLFDPIGQTVRERAQRVYWENISIVPAALGDDVVLLGALALALERIG